MVDAVTTQRRNRCGLLVFMTMAAGACTSSTGSATPRAAVVVVNAPVAELPSVAEPIVRGTRLAVDEVNRAGGLRIGDQRMRLRVTIVDNGLSPEQSAANVRRAVAAGAVAVVDEGTGVDASWSVAAAANLPIGIVRQGGEQL